MSLYYNLTPDLARKAIAVREQIQVRIGTGDPVFLQVVLQQGAKFSALVSTPDATTVTTFDSIDLSMVLVVKGGPQIEPIRFSADPADIVDARVFGHNGIAEAVVLLAAFGLPAQFGYTKPAKGKTRPRRELRDVRLQWCDGERFGGADYSRNMAGRSFRLDRVDTMQLGPKATAAPVWTGDEYVRGLP